MQRADERALIGALACVIAALVARNRHDQRAPALPAVSLVRDGETWVVSGRGESCRLRDSRGLQMLARLVVAAGEEVHVLELAGGTEPIDAGDAGEVLDGRARNEYRARSAALREAIAEAEARGDRAVCEQPRTELAALTAELSRAVGLGGRPRRAGAAAERARVNAQRRISDALRRLADLAPRLGLHLARTVRTGAFCSYLPERDP